MKLIVKTFYPLLAACLLSLYDSNAAENEVETSKDAAEKEDKIPEEIRELMAIRISGLKAKGFRLGDLVEVLSTSVRIPVEGDDPEAGKVTFLNYVDPERVEKRSIEVKDIRMDEFFAVLAKLYGVEFHVTSVGVVVTPPDRPPFPNEKSEEGTVWLSFLSE